MRLKEIASSSSSEEDEKSSSEDSESSMTSSDSDLSVQSGRKDPRSRVFGKSESCINELFLFSSSDGSFSSSNEIFVNLTTLIIHHQPLLSLTGIDSLNHLNELWITECSIKDFATVQSCTKLKYLHLYSNDLTMIPKLPNLKQLELLGLTENKITTIENLECLLELRKLYLADNEIRIIGCSLQTNTKLTELDIAGNPIRSLNDLRHLAQNNMLESLACTNFTEQSLCPVTLKCNYRSFLIHHLPQLVVLDSFPVDQAERTKVKEFYGKSIMYYNMLHHRYLRKHFAETTLEDNTHKEMLATIKQAQIALKLRSIETSQINKRFVKKLPGPIQQIEELPKKISEWKKHVIQLKIKHEKRRRLVEDQLNLELRAVGNLSFRYEINDITLISLCQKLMKDFTCENLATKNGSLDLKVLDAYRVVNNEEVTNEDGHIYMLLAKTFTAISHLCDWFEDGWHASGEYELTTCLATADAYWLSDVALLNTNQTSCKEDRHIALILKLPPDTKMANADQIFTDSCTRHRQPLSCSRLAGVKSSLPKEPESQSCHKLRISNPKCIPSMCVVEYCYVFDKFTYTDVNLKTSCQEFMNDVINGPANACINSIDFVNHEVWQKIAKHLKHPEPWNALTKISLQGLELDDQFGETVPQFKSAQFLDMSYNKITTLDFIARLFPNLRDLNLSFNKITSLSTLPFLDSLVNLDLSWNEIKKATCCFQVLSKYCNLERLDLSYNPILDFINQDHLTIIASQHLPLLKTLNGIHMNTFLQDVCVINLEDEAAGKGYIYEKYPMPLCLRWTSKLPQLQPCYVGDKNHVAKVKHMWISLRDRRAVQLTNLPLNVTQADLAGNFITDLKFLESWTMLEELSLSRNIITSLNKGILSIQNIIKLDFSENYIKSLVCLREGHLISLRYLDVSNNKLKSFEGLENCTALRELYATNNYISKLKDLVEIKPCRQLKVIDLSSNEISLLEEFVNYVVFHFRKIEYVNSQYVQESDLQEAYELYGGILDSDYLLRRHKKTELKYLKHMSITQCNIKKISLAVDLLPCLETLNLEGNEISCLIGAHSLPALVSLNLGFNQINRFFDECSSNVEICFPKLETLYLNNNHITSLDTLNLSPFPSLVSLFLQGNQLQNIRGLKENTNLENLLIDRNKIDALTLEDCAHLKNIGELYLEGNKIKDLSFLKSLPKLTKLFAGHNKIEDHEQLKNLAALTQLRELTLLGNPFCRVFQHYRQAMTYAPTLEMLDGFSLDINTFF